MVHQVLFTENGKPPDNGGNDHHHGDEFEHQFVFGDENIIKDILDQKSKQSCGPGHDHHTGHGHEQLEPVFPDQCQNVLVPVLSEEFRYDFHLIIVVFLLLSATHHTQVGQPEGTARRAPTIRSWQ
jgi:hypothetical protein